MSTKRTKAMATVLAVTCLSLSGAERTGITAREEARTLREGIRAAHASGDAAAYVSLSRKLKNFLHDSPESVLQLMAAQTFAGDIAGALESLRHFVSLGQADEAVLGAKPFDALRASPGFAEVQAAMKKNNEPVLSGREMFTFEKEDLLPEDVDYDARTARFFVTSVLQKEILAVDMKGDAHVFARAPDEWPMLAVKVDARHHTLWATEVALKGFKWAPETAWGRSVVLVYDLDSGKLLHRIEGPPGAALGDMTLTQDGDAIVSDGEGGGVYRVSRLALQLEKLDSGQFISPQTAAVSKDGRLLFVPDYSRGVAVLDLRSKHVTWLEGGGAHALSGVDGLYLEGSTLLATQNGSSPERVIAFKLDGPHRKVIAETVLERSTPTLGDPTHGVVCNGSFYYLANSGWDAVGEDGSLKDGKPMKHARMMRVDLSQALQ